MPVARVMGEVIEFDLPSVLGEPLSLETYRGQIVLMPFWDSRFPESLQLLPTLRQLREEHPEAIAVIGVNLDPEGADVRSFVRERGIDFPNFRAATSSDGPVRNEVANRFGIVSMPFTVVLDREGRVTSIDLNGGSLEATVSRLGVSGNQAIDPQRRLRDRPD